jgi:cytochrome c
VNFQGIDAVRYRVSAGPEGGGTIEMRLGSPTGELLASTPVASTGGWFTFTETTPTPIEAPEGTHDVYLVFESNPGVNWSMTLDVFEAIGAGVGTPPPGTPVVDTTTQGDWIGTYGELGYAIPDIGSDLPDGVTIAPAAGTAAYTFAQTTTDKAALQVPPAGTSRRATTWFAGTAQIDVGIPAGEAYQLSVYVNSFDSSRQETITLVRPDGSLVGPAQTVTDNKRGLWLTYQVVGPVQVKAARVTGPNAVIGGIFLDEADSPGDEDAPTVTVDAGAPGESGWYTDDVAIELTATDGAGSGVESIEYAIADGDWSTYDTAVTVEDEGETLVRYRATDKAGNVSEVGELTVKLDRTVPTVIATSAEAPADDQWNTRGITLTLTADDGAGSGIAAVQYAVGDADWSSYTAPVRISAEGPSDIRYRALDVAGNASEVGELEIPDPPALDITATASTRCIAGKVLVTVKATNDESVPVAITLESAYGTKSFAAVAPGKNAVHTFTTRQAGVPADVVGVSATAVVNGAPVTVSIDTAYAAASCQ